MNHQMPLTVSNRRYIISGHPSRIFGIRCAQCSKTLFVGLLINVHDDHLTIRVDLSSSLPDYSNCCSSTCIMLRKINVNNFFLIFFPFYFLFVSLSVLIGCQIGSFPLPYLVMPLSIQKPRVVDFFSL